jgi:Kef-type K+ transport system membrane component KefB
MIPTALFLLFALGILAHLFGLHVAIGAYLAGLILTQDMFAINKEDDPSFAGNVCYESYKELDKFIYNLTVNFLGPIFFIFLGAQLSIESNNIGEVLIFSLVVFLFVSFFQVSSAYLAAKKTTDLDTKNSLLVGFGMLPRDVLAFVILEIAISNKLIDPGTIYSTVIVISILLLNLVTPLFLGYLKKKYKKEFEDEISKIK